MNKKRLLIVDDDPSLREIFRLFMEKEGYEVDEAEDGAKGIDRVKAFKPDAIVLDLMMPVMNGVEVLKKLRDADLFARVPVIVVTGFGDQAKEQEIKGFKNVAHFMKKPVDYVELTAKVKALLGEAAAG